MKYFVCGLGKIHLAIPAEQTERIISVTRVQAGLYETENQEAFISLPALFQQKGINAPHGIVLKCGAEGTAKTVLLTPRIDAEMEIPEEDINRLPEVFVRLLRFFRGAYFTGADTGQNLIFILNPGTLMENIR